MAITLVLLGLLISIAYYHLIIDVKNVKIPIGHVGVLTTKDGVVEPEPLLPGKYKINLNRYTVTLVNTEPQVYIMGEESK